MKDFNFTYSATLSKAGKSKNGRIPVTIIPSIPTKDRVNDVVTLKAFDEECKKEFLFDGVIDYDHLSYRSDNPLIKAQAIIGQPLDLFVKSNIPYCDADLFEKNPFVQGSILPALESGSTVFGASVGGSVLKSTPNDPLDKSAGKTISKVRLKHIAICPKQNAIHQGTGVMLRKSLSTDGEVFHFNNFDDLVKSFNDQTMLEKALTAGSATDISGMSGGQVLQPQSLEGSTVRLNALVSDKKLKAVMPFVLESIKTGILKGGYDSFKNGLVNKGLTKSEAEKLIRLIAENSVKIVSAFKK